MGPKQQFEFVDQSWVWWFASIILVTQEAELRDHGSSPPQAKSL
jgi:hypothetical protein